MNDSQKRWAFWALAAAFLVDFLGYAFIVPILPSWKQEFALSNTEATALVSLWAVPLFILGPKTGRITDRLGAGRTILFSLFSLTIASLLYLVGDYLCGRLHHSNCKAYSRCIRCCNPNCRVRSG